MSCLNLSMQDLAVARFFRAPKKDSSPNKRHIIAAQAGKHQPKSMY